MDLQTHSQSSNTAPVRDSNPQSDVTSTSGQENAVEARTIANSDGLEALGWGEKKLKIGKMLRAGFDPKEVSRELGSPLSYVYKVKKELEEPPIPRVELVVLPTDQDLQEAKTRRNKDRMLLALFHCKGIVSDALRMIKDCTYPTHLQWMKEDPWYCDRVAEIQESVIDYVEGHLLKQIKKGVPVSTIFFLKTKAKHRGYTEKEVGDTNITVNNIRVIEPFVDPLAEEDENREAIDAEYTVLEPQV